jgi:hypothetical protein
MAVSVNGGDRGRLALAATTSDAGRPADSDAAECGRSTLASGESGIEVPAAEDSGEGALARTGAGLSVRAALLGAAHRGQQLLEPHLVCLELADRRLEPSQRTFGQ